MENAMGALVALALLLLARKKAVLGNYHLVWKLLSNSPLFAGFASSVLVARFQSDGVFRNDSYLRSRDTLAAEPKNFTACAFLTLAHLRGEKSYSVSYADSKSDNAFTIGNNVISTFAICNFIIFILCFSYCEKAQQPVDDGVQAQVLYQRVRHRHQDCHQGGADFSGMLF